MMRSWFVVVLAAIGMALATGCGSDDGRERQEAAERQAKQAFIAKTDRECRSAVAVVPRGGSARALVRATRRAQASAAQTVDEFRRAVPPAKDRRVLE